MGQTRLSALDATFVYGESQRVPLHVGSLTIVEATPLRNADGVLNIQRLREDVAARLHLIPRFRQRLVEVPFDQGRPVWVDDVRFRIEDHVRLIGLPRPGHREQLFELMAQLQSVQMDRTRPLWEIWYVDGLEDGNNVGVITKIHHCMIDGTSGVEIGTLLYDLQRDGTRLDPPAWQPEAEPSRGELLLAAMTDIARGALDSVRTLVEVVRQPSKTIEQVAGLVKAVECATEEIDTLPFNTRVSSRRSFNGVAVPFEYVLHVRKAFGVKVNDVVLAVLTGALRAYCENRRIKPGSLERIRALVPVNRRQPGDTELGSKVSSLFVELPVAERSVAGRLKRLAEQTRSLKDAKVADGTDMWNRLTSVLPVPLLRIASQMQFGGLVKTCNLLVSNIRGPENPLYSSGAEVSELYPYFGIQDNVGLTIVVFSYNGKMHFGVTSDPEIMPDADVLVEAIPHAVDQLLRLALRRTGASLESISATPTTHVHEEPPRRRAAGGH
jgi:diacylglycerol O-acyltransferase / wax synthase